MTAAFENGTLTFRAGEERSKEIVLALPLDRLLVTLVKVGSGETPAAVAEPVLKAMSPYPDEPLTVSCENVLENPKGESIYLAAALPEGATDDLIDALNAAKVNVTRVDALVLGALRGLWAQLQPKGRQALLIRESRTVALFVLDDGNPVAIRALSPEGDLKRELILSLIQAEDFGGPAELREIVVCGEVAGADALGLAPVRRVEPGAEALQTALQGVSDRTKEAGSFNALPASWAEVLEEERFKSKLYRGLGCVGGLWAVLMAALFLVPVVYDFRADQQKDLSRGISRAYREVKQLQDETALVKDFSNQDHSAIEVLRVLAQNLPVGVGAVQLDKFEYTEGKGIQISGEAANRKAVTSFCNNLAAVHTEPTRRNPDGESVFTVSDPSINADNKTGRQHFSFELKFVGEGEEEQMDFKSKGGRK